jgi:hypothetical protein
VGNNSLVRTVLTTMIKSAEYFFFAFAGNRGMTAFRTEIGQETLTGLIDNLQRLRSSTTTDSEYEHALVQFRRQASPPGQLLEWVCRDNLDYLDLNQDRLEMRPGH